MKNKISSIITFIIISIFFLTIHSCQSKSSSNTSEPTKDTIAVTTPIKETSTEEKTTTCEFCGTKFIGRGYQMISEGVCEPCVAPYQSFLCSPRCAIETGKKTTEEFNEILNKHGYGSLDENQDNNNQSDSECSFYTDSDVLSYLIGKTFKQQGGGIEIQFSSDGAIISGQEEYQWQTYKSLGGYKGYVKLASINPSHPDGTIKLWVSCRENSVTDGQTVLLYN
jgi:hypothetical protein